MKVLQCIYIYVSICVASAKLDCIILFEYFGYTKVLKQSSMKELIIAHEQ